MRWSVAIAALLASSCHKPPTWPDPASELDAFCQLARDSQRPLGWKDLVHRFSEQRHALSHSNFIRTALLLDEAVASREPYWTLTRQARQLGVEWDCPELRDLGLPAWVRSDRARDTWLLCRRAKLEPEDAGAPETDGYLLEPNGWGGDGQRPTPEGQRLFSELRLAEPAQRFELLRSELEKAGQNMPKDACPALSGIWMRTRRLSVSVERRALQWRLLESHNVQPILRVRVHTAQGSPVSDADVVALWEEDGFIARRRSDSLGLVSVLAHVPGDGLLRVYAQRSGLGAGVGEVRVGRGRVDTVGVEVTLNPDLAFDFPTPPPCTSRLQQALATLAPGACLGRTALEMTYSAPNALSLPSNREDHLLVGGMELSGPRGRPIRRVIAEVRGSRAGEYRFTLTASLGSPREDLGALAWLCPLTGMERTLRYGRKPGPRARITIKSKGCALDDPLEDKVEVILEE